jgi:hypothetical protein
VIRLYVLVEGQTEAQFVQEVLGPVLMERLTYCYPVIVETSRDVHGRKRRGGGRWARWSRDLKRLTGEQSGGDVRFTTMFDLYGLPSDFPGLAEARGAESAAERCGLLEQSMAAAVGDRRLIPNIVCHEFEALLLAALESLELLLDNPRDRAGLGQLRADIGELEPEDVDDGPETAPSKRIARRVPGFRKTVHGPEALARAGLTTLRQRCPRFDAWVSKLESQGELAQ